MEDVMNIKFNREPFVCVRVISKYDDKTTKNSKKKYPFRLKNDVIVTVTTSLRTFSFKIKLGYIWNGADIPKPLWWIGSSKDNAYLVASLVHDYMLEFKKYILNDILENKITPHQLRRLTSLIFREILKTSSVGPIKSWFMSFFVDIYQATINRKAWSKVICEENYKYAKV